MKKQLLLISSLGLLFTNCKKEAQPTAPADEVKAQGTWSLIADSGNNNGLGYLLTSAMLPCIEGNKIFVNSDGTASLEYTSQDTCFVSRTANGFSTLGLPGEKRAATWTQSGKTLFIQVNNQSKRFIGNLAVVNGKQQLTFNDTTTVGQAKYIHQGVYAK